MYTFKKCDPKEHRCGGSNICNIGSSIEAHSCCLGQVITLFGQPDSITGDYEDVFSCAVSAEDEAGNVLYLEIYHGPSGPAIGGDPDSEEHRAAAKELAELISSAQPADYDWEGVYADIPANIRMGVRNGKPYYESEISEDFM